MSCFTTGGPGKEQGTKKPPPTRRVQERSKGNTICPTTSQNPSLWHPSWLNKACTTRKDSESEWLAKDNRETNRITIKPKTASHVTELFSWVPLPYCSLPGCPLPIKSLALPAHVSPGTIHFWVLDKSPVSGPERGPPSYNTTRGNMTQPQCLLTASLDILTTGSWLIHSLTRSFIQHKLVTMEIWVETVLNIVAEQDEEMTRQLPGGPVVSIQHFHCQEPGFDSWSGC